MLPPRPAPLSPSAVGPPLLPRRPPHRPCPFFNYRSAPCSWPLHLQPVASTAEPASPWSVEWRRNPLELLRRVALSSSGAAAAFRLGRPLRSVFLASRPMAPLDLRRPCLPRPQPVPPHPGTRAPSPPGLPRAWQPLAATSSPEPRSSLRRLHPEAATRLPGAVVPSPPLTPSAATLPLFSAHGSRTAPPSASSSHLRFPLACPVFV